MNYKLYCCDDNFFKLFFSNSLLPRNLCNYLYYRAVTCTTNKRVDYSILKTSKLINSKFYHYGDNFVTN